MTSRAGFVLLLLLALGLVAPACSKVNTVDVDENNTPVEDKTLNKTEYTITDAEWDETAVRKVLHVFAYGGKTTDAQIKTWADMKPEDAINEIISVQTVNEKLSPSDPVYKVVKGTLTNLGKFWSSPNLENPVPGDRRKRYDSSEWNSPANIWCLAVQAPGLNPVRQRIGLFETNYHLSANLDVGVGNEQILTHYDSILDALATGLSYEDVLAMAAISASIATQYNHKENVFEEGTFLGNEDFGREFHQLFFGILGDADPDYHEFTSIRNTAKALTHMTVERKKDGDRTYWSEEVTFGTGKHYPGELEILNQTIAGKTARDKITSLAKIAIKHAESMANLPLIIVRGLADDNLTAENVTIIQAIWAGLENRNMIMFLRRYAISKAFHSSSRIKFYSPFTRETIIRNKIALTAKEVYRNLYNVCDGLNDDGISPFRPVHDVFGHVTGLETADGMDFFKRAYNRAFNWMFHRTNDDGWEKDWAKVIPKSGDGTWRAKQVSEWLWNRFIGDGLKNFGTLERAHVISLLVSGKDLSIWLDEKDPARVYTKDELENDRTLADRLKDAEIAILSKLEAADVDDRRNANYRVGLAISFITATPYMFAQEGK